MKLVEHAYDNSMPEHEQNAAADYDSQSATKS
jgi:hypothetical protein